MKRRLSFLLAAMGLALGLQAKELLEIKGDYLLYSYDFNAIYGQGKIQLRSKNWTIQAGMVEVDITGRVALASRGCRVEVGKKRFEADLLEIDLESLSLKFTSFKESIRSWTLPGTPTVAKEKGAAAKKSGSRGRDPVRLRPARMPLPCRAVRAPGGASRRRSTARHRARPRRDCHRSARA